MNNYLFLILYTKINMFKTTLLNIKNKNKNQNHVQNYTFEHN